MQRSSFSEVLDEQFTQLRSLLVREHEEETELRMEQQELELERLRIRVRQLEAHVEKAQNSLDLVKPKSLRKRSEGDGERIDSGNASSADQLSVVPVAPAPLPNVIEPPSSEGPDDASGLHSPPALETGREGGFMIFGAASSLDTSRLNDARFNSGSVEIVEASVELVRASCEIEDVLPGRGTSNRLEVGVASVTSDTCSDSWSSSDLAGEAMTHVKTEPSVRASLRPSAGASGPQVSSFRSSLRVSSKDDMKSVGRTSSHMSHTRSTLTPLPDFNQLHSPVEVDEKCLSPLGSERGGAACEPTMADLGDSHLPARRSWSHSATKAKQRSSAKRASGVARKSEGTGVRLSGIKRLSGISKATKMRTSLKSKKGGLMRAFSGGVKPAGAARAGHAVDDVLTFVGNAVRSFRHGAPPHRRPEEFTTTKDAPSERSASPVPQMRQDSLLSGRSRKNSDADDGCESAAPNELNHFELLELHPTWQVERRATQARSSHIFRGTTQMFRFNKNPGGNKLEQLAERPQGESCLSKMIIHPHCAPRIMWDMLGFLLIMWDLIMVPMQIFEPEKDSFLEYFEWFSRCYWTMDIGVNFFTGYLEEDGGVVKVWTRVAEHYARRWLILDVAVVVLVWLEVTSEGLSQARFLKGVRGSRGTLRILRAIRLLRLLRMDSKSQYAFRSLSFLVRSEELMIVLGIVKIMCIIGMLVHLIACFWYGVGLLGAESADSSGTGWLVENDLKHESLGYRYVTSYHWSLAQFTGSDSITPLSHIERAFAVLTLFPAFVISACVVSSITTSMTQLQILSAHSSRQLTQLHRYLQDHGISATLATRVKQAAQHFIQEQKRNTPESSVELLTVLSQPLRVELAYEVHGPVLQWHPFFRVYNRMSPAGLRQICHAAVQRLFLTKDDVLFNDGEMPAQPRMFFAVTGELAYKRKGKPVEYVEAGEWISEPVLWTTSWFHHGGMSASTECNLLCLIADQFQQITKQFMTGPNFQPGLYAQFYLESLNKVPDDDRKECYCEDYLDVSDITQTFCAD